MDNTPYQKYHLRTTEAAKYLNLSKSALDKLRFKSGGPPFSRLGRIIVYSVSDLDKWVLSNRQLSVFDPPGHTPEALESTGHQ